jgi:hypothetical protein
MRKSIRTIEAPTHKADASAHLSDEFPAGYSLMRCSPAVLVSALPAGVDYASGLIQVRGIFNNERSRTEKRNEIHRQRSTLRSPFFCPKNGETLKMPAERSLLIGTFVFEQTAPALATRGHPRLT